MLCGRNTFVCCFVTAYTQKHTHAVNLQLAHYTETSGRWRRNEYFSIKLTTHTNKGNWNISALICHSKQLYRFTNFKHLYTYMLEGPTESKTSPTQITAFFCTLDIGSHSCEGNRLRKGMIWRWEREETEREREHEHDDHKIGGMIQK